MGIQLYGFLWRSPLGSIHAACELASANAQHDRQTETWRVLVMAVLGELLSTFSTVPKPGHGWLQFRGIMSTPFKLYPPCCFRLHYCLTQFLPATPQFQEKRCDNVESSWSGVLVWNCFSCSLSLSFSFFFPFSLSMFLAMSGCPSVSRSVCFTIIYFDAPAHVKKHEETCDNCALRHPRAESCVLPKPAKCKPSPSVIAFLGVWQSESSIKQRNHNRA